MKNQPAISSAEARTIDGVFVYRDTQRPGTWRYVPPFPLPETDTQGRPMARLWITEPAAILQLGARWTVAPASLDRIRQQLITEACNPADMDPNLQPAPASITQASLTTAQEADNPVILASSTTSGVPPWSVIFNASVSPPLLPMVRAAFEDDDEQTLVSYHGEFTQWLPVKACITGDARQELAQLPPFPSAEVARKQVDRALESGRFKLSVESPPGAAEADLQAVAEEARSIAASLLTSMAAENSPDAYSLGFPDSARMKAIAHRQTNASVSFTSSIPLCRWFPNGTGCEHVNEIGQG